MFFKKTSTHSTDSRKPNAAISAIIPKTT